MTPAQIVEPQKLARKWKPTTQPMTGRQHRQENGVPDMPGTP